MEEYDSNIPIYLQIIGKINYIIMSGEWRAGDKIPSVRDLAVRFTVNPNTMQRALSELERDGLIYSERTVGRFVTEDSETINIIRSRIASKNIKEFLQNMECIGFSRDEIIAQLREDD